MGSAHVNCHLKRGKESLKALFVPTWLHTEQGATDNKARTRECETNSISNRASDDHAYSIKQTDIDLQQRDDTTYIVGIASRSNKCNDDSVLQQAGDDRNHGRRAGYRTAILVDGIVGIECDETQVGSNGVYLQCFSSSKRAKDHQRIVCTDHGKIVKEMTTRLPSRRNKNLKKSDQIMHSLPQPTQTHKRSVKR